MAPKPPPEVQPSPVAEPAEAKRRIGPAMTKADILELVNGSYN